MLAILKTRVCSEGWAGTGHRSRLYEASAPKGIHRKLTHVFHRFGSFLARPIHGLVAGALGFRALLAFASDIVDLFRRK